MHAIASVTANTASGLGSSILRFFRLAHSDRNQRILDELSTKTDADADEKDFANRNHAGGTIVNHAGSSIIGSTTTSGTNYNSNSGSIVKVEKAKDKLSEQDKKKRMMLLGNL